MPHFRSFSHKYDCKVCLFPTPLFSLPPTLSPLPYPYIAQIQGSDDTPAAHVKNHTLDMGSNAMDNAVQPKQRFVPENYSARNAGGGLSMPPERHQRALKPQAQRSVQQQQYGCRGFIGRDGGKTSIALPGHPSPQGEPASIPLLKFTNRVFDDIELGPRKDTRKRDIQTPQHWSFSCFFFRIGSCIESY